MRSTIYSCDCAGLLFVDADLAGIQRRIWRRTCNTYFVLLEVAHCTETTRASYIPVDCFEPLRGLLKRRSVACLSEDATLPPTSHTESALRIPRTLELELELESYFQHSPGLFPVLPRLWQLVGSPAAT